MGSEESGHAPTLHSGNFGLLSEVQLFDDRAVTLDVGLLQVAKKVSSVTNHLQKSAAAVVILVVSLEVLGQIVDSVSQKRDLNLGRTCVALVGSVLLDNCLLFVFQHFVFHLSAKMQINLSLTQASVGEVPMTAFDPRSELTTCVVIITQFQFFVKGF